MQPLLEHIGVGVSAITGVLAARNKRVDLFGVIVLAVVTGLGGGSVRDLLLGVRPVFWVSDPRYLLTATAVAVVSFFAARVHEFPALVLLVADACALAFFTTLGVQKALGLEVAGPIAVAMGVITGVVGGILRDTLTGEIPLVFRQEIYLYATAAFCGASVLVLLHHTGTGAQFNLLAATATTLALRLAGIRWKISLPVFKSRT